MPSRLPPRVGLLHLPHLRPVRLALTVPVALLLNPARNMSTKPSLEAAEDFLSFVNASPTRMLFCPMHEALR